MPIPIVSKLLHSRISHFTLNIIKHFVNHTVVNDRHSEHYNAVSVYCDIIKACWSPNIFQRILEHIIAISFLAMIQINF